MVPSPLAETTPHFEKGEEAHNASLPVKENIQGKGFFCILHHNGSAIGRPNYAKADKRADHFLRIRILLA